MKGRVRGVGVWTAAFVASLLLWLVLTSTVAWNEVLTGVVAAALAATAAWLAARRRAPRPQDRWPDALRLAGGWRVLAVLPWRVAADTVRAVRGSL